MIGTIQSNNLVSPTKLYMVDRANSQTYAGGRPYDNETGLTCNKNMLDDIVDYPAEAQDVGPRQNGSLISTFNLVHSIRGLAIYYAKIVRGLYGVTGGNTCPSGSASPWSAYEIFYIRPQYHTTHYDSVVSAISSASAPEMSGDVTFPPIKTYMDRVMDIITSRKNEVTVDIRVCHSSCHGSCHASRGRR